jgi:hypothetical protein
MDRTMLLPVLVAVAVGPPAAAGEAAFQKTRLQVVEKGKTKLVPVDLRFDGRRIIIARRKEAGPPLDIPYSSITSMSYEMAKRDRIEEGGTLMLASLGAGAVLMATKTKSHWLAVEYNPGAGPQAVVLQLHKSEYGSVIQALEAASGRRVELLSSSDSRIDPTRNSTNVDELLSYPPERVRLALKPAMEKFACQVAEESEVRVVCKRAKGRSEATGIGGEKIIASLTPQGDATRVVIETEKGFGGRMRKKNWSTPIYNEMVKELKRGG